MDLPLDPALGPRLADDTASLRRLARGLVHDGTGGEDLVQEAWLTALSRGPVEARGSGWLAGVLRHKASEARRAEGRRRRHEAAGARGGAVPSAGDAAAQLEVLGRVIAALGALDEPYRTAVVLRYLDDLPPREIARRTGVPVNTARSRVQRGLSRLRAELDGETGRGREGLLSVLAPLAGPPPVTVAAAGATTGWIGVMSMKKSTILAVAAVVGTLTLLGLERWAAPARIDSSDERLAVESEVDALDREGDAEVVLEPVGPVAADASRMDASLGEAATPAGDWRVHGLVRSSDGAALAGVPVHLELLRGTSEGGETEVRAVLETDEHGGFTWPLPAPSSMVTVEVLAGGDGWYGWTHTARALPGEEAPRFELTLYPIDAAITGVVRAEDGAPVPGASVWSGSGRTRADALGEYVLEVPGVFREQRLRAVAPGFAEAQVSLSFAEGRDEAHADITLAAGRSLAGCVVDEEGLALSEVDVRAFGIEAARDRTGPDGRFELAGLPRAELGASLVAERTGFLTTTIELSEIDPGSRPGDEPTIVLRRGMRLEGRVVDELGAPVLGAELWVGRGSHSVGTVHSWSEIDGTFVFETVPAGRATLVASRDGYAEFRTELALPTDGSAPDALVVELVRGRGQDGLVFDAQGAPVPGARVRVLNREGGQVGHADTDARGRFRLENLPDGRLRVSVGATGFVDRSVDVKRDVAEWILELERASGLAGLVLDAVTAEPVDAFRVRFLHPELESGERYAGGYGIEWMEEGVYFGETAGRWKTRRDVLAPGSILGIEVIAEGYAPALLSRVAVPVEPRHEDLVIRLERGCELTGTVTDLSSGAPIPGALVHLRVPGVMRRAQDAEHTFGRAWTRADSDGRFRFEHAPSGELTLEVEADDYPPAVDGPFVLTRGTRAHERHVVLGLGATLFGRTFGPDGRPVAGAQLLLQDLEPDYASGRRHQWNATADDQGSYRIEGLPPGRYELSRRERDDVVERSWPAVLQRLELGEADLELDLAHGGRARLQGTATLPDEVQGPVLVSLLWNPSDGGELIGRPRVYATLIRDGLFEIAGLPSGEYTLLCGDRPPGVEGLLVGRADLTVTAGETVEATIEITRID